MSAQVVSEAADRPEIDTSSPLKSVKEAATFFGGFGLWRPSSQRDNEVVDISKLEEEAAQLEKDLLDKESETLSVLKELEDTKLIVEELKMKLQKELSDVNTPPVGHTGDVVQSYTDLAEEENRATYEEGETVIGGPDFTLLELKQAKVNLATTPLVDIRAAVESYTREIENERISFEKTREWVLTNTFKVLFLEEELNQTRQKQQEGDDAKGDISFDDPMFIRTKEMQKLSSEAKQFKEMQEAARLDILKAMSEIEQTKTRLKTAEIRLIEARKLKEAARANEAVALSEIKAISDSDIMLNVEEYTSLLTKAREAEEVLNVDQTNVSRAQMLKKVEEVEEEVKTSKKALEEALGQLEAANRGKLAAEAALRKWTSDRRQNRRAFYNNTKFKNSGTSHHRKDSSLLDVNGTDLDNDVLKPVVKPTLSIGKILRRKLLGKLLGKSHVEIHSSTCNDEDENNSKQMPAKRKKFGLSRISFLAAKQFKKKKKQTASSNNRSV